MTPSIRKADNHSFWFNFTFWKGFYSLFGKDT